MTPLQRLRKRHPDAARKGKGMSAPAPASAAAPAGEGSDIPLHCDYLLSRVDPERLAGDAEWKFHALGAALSDAVVVLDPQGRIRDWNPGAEHIFGYPAGEALGRDFVHLVAASCGKGPATAGDWSGAAGGSFACEARHRDGKPLRVEATVIAGGPACAGNTLLCIRFHGACRRATRLMRQSELRLDALARKQEEMEAAFSQRQSRDERLIWQLMHHDPVTGLPNRERLNERIRQALAQAEASNGRLALLSIGIDHFNSFNDTLGHPVGDYILTTVASRLNECVASLNNLARLGGDQFVVVLPDLGDAAAAEATAQELLEAVAKPIAVADHELVLHASVGIAVFPENGRDVDTLLKNADAAMNLAKSEGSDSCRFYSDELNARALTRLALEESLRRALERGELEVHYQPQIDLRSGCIDGAEALLRWQHPELGPISPQQFIPLAEESGLIVPIGEWVLQTACAQLKAWQDAGARDLRMAVNLSVRQFRQPGLPATVRDIVRRTGVRAADLELEITESMLMQDAERGIAMLEELKRLGVRLAIDDFGTGYSSLNYLRHFPIDTLKIDRSFVTHLPRDGNDAAIVRAILALAQCLRLKVVAEGVETDMQLRFMYSHGCDKIQGFLFSPPLAAAAFAALLAEEQPLRTRAASLPA